MGKPRHRLADGDHLAGLGQGRGDHAGGVGLEVRIIELVAREIEGTSGAVEATLRLVARRFLALEIGRGCPALALELGVSLEVRRGLGQVRGGGSELGLGALHLQLEILRIEVRDHIAHFHAVADIDDAGDDLAGDAKAEIGLVARAHHAHELTRPVRILEVDPLHHHRALGLHGWGGVGLTAGQSQRRDQCKQPAREKVTPADTQM